MKEEGATQKSTIKWYLRPPAIFLAILLVGPLALPLLWVSPAIKRRHKIWVTVLLIAIAVWFIKYSAWLYRTLSEDLKEISEIMSGSI